MKPMSLDIINEWKEEILECFGDGACVDDVAFINNRVRFIVKSSKNTWANVNLRELLNRFSLVDQIRDSEDNVWVTFDCGLKVGFMLPQNIYYDTVGYASDIRSLTMFDGTKISDTYPLSTLNFKSMHSDAKDEMWYSYFRIEIAKLRDYLASHRVLVDEIREVKYKLAPGPNGGRAEGYSTSCGYFIDSNGKKILFM